MPRTACRDSGLACDWFFENDDISAVLVEGLKHTDEAHPEILADMTKKYKPWEVVAALLRVIKR